jgi:hypothetical protein
MPRNLRMLIRRDLREKKGIPWSRQHLNEKIKDGTFPPPDGKTSDSPTAPNFWFEHTIDRYLRERAKAEQTRKVATATTQQPPNAQKPLPSGSAGHVADQTETTETSRDKQ